MGTKLPEGIFFAANSASFSDLTLKTDFCKPVFNKEEKVFIYDDICKNYWHNEHRFAIDVDRVHYVFLDGIFERQMYDF